jgi:hypothetical protein
MDYTLTAIMRDDIPHNICVYRKHDVTVPAHVFLFEFTGGYKIIYESDTIISSIVEILDDLMYYYNIWNDIKFNCNDPLEFQGYYLENYHKYITSDDCERIWNYHINNEESLIDLLSSYSINENDILEDEGIIIDHII